MHFESQKAFRVFRDRPTVVRKTMKAIVKTKAEPRLWLEDVPVPEVGGDDVLMWVLKASHL
jgi:hypothetical protein